ncbi:MAG: extracellular elastinolytic metalloproteinase [Saprospiraceae bacterium]|jgi:extracellular elastinolytic metalloproteinase
MHSIFTKKSSFLAFFLLLAGSSIFAQSAENTAIQHLRENLLKLNLTEADINSYRISDEVYTKHNGVTSIYLMQEYEGVEVFNAMINVNILPNGEILSMGNKFIPNLLDKVNGTTPQISMEAAIEAVQNKFEIETTAPILEKERISETEATFKNSGLALEPIKVKLKFQPTEDDKVRLTWNVSYYELDAQNWWNARVDAITGEVLHHHNQVIHCDFGVPGEVCQEDHVHTHSTIQEKTTMAPPPTSNGYNVFAIPLESPNHGDQSLEINPAHPIASPLGWHDTDGQPGHEFTITRGNNVHAYHDIFDQNQSVGGEPDGGDSLLFDFVYDEDNTQPYTQLDAATTNLFYWNNIIHDLWYQYGFDEGSGNFQENNYGNGGQAGDYVRAEAIDGSGTNNANFATPEDGNRPRMQMYLWGGGGGTVAGNTVLIVDSPATVAGEYEMTQMSFSAELPSLDDPIISQIVLVDDGVAAPNVNDGCEDIINGADIDGKIAMVDRGDCQFGFKALAAEQAGAIAVIICNNVNNPINNGNTAGTVGDQVTVPVVWVSLADCNTIKMGLPDLEVTFGASPFEVPNPGPTGRDSDLDNGVIVHEYGHGISTRLTGGPNNSNCLGSAEQAGEGWSDWFALVMQTTSDMTAEQGRGIGTYLEFQPITGGGIRQFRYSRDMGVNPHTYAAVPNVAQPHGVGSVWCVMIWDLYWNMVDKYGFDEDLFNGVGGNNLTMQLVIDGLKLQPCSPDFTEARDAIIAADIANNNGDNVCLIWETFARRGLGFSASPGGNEAFDTPILCFGGVRVFKSADVAADAGGNLIYSLQIVNGTTEDLPEAMVTDILPAGMTYVEGSLSCNGSVDTGVVTIPFANLESEMLITCTYEVTLDNTPFSYVEFDDNFEGGSGNWLKENAGGDNDWKFSANDALSGSFTFFAENVEVESDQYLLLEESIMLEGANPSFGFWHFYNTEAAFDGGVVEITTDGGTTWQDLGPLFIQNGYNSTISPTATSALAGRDAFTGDSGNDYAQSIIDLSDFSGETIQIRFRFATDDGTADEGWRLDDIELFGAFYSVTNTACIVDENGDEQCSEASTVIFGEQPNATIDNELDAEISIYPNPAQSKFFVKMDNAPSERVQLTIRGIDGRVILVQQRNAFEIMEINVSNFSAGVYVVELLMEEGIAVRKLVVE